MKDLNLRPKTIRTGEVSVSQSSEAALRGERHRLGAIEIINAVLELVKVRITFFVGMSAMFGYILASGGISIKMIMPVLGIFLLSCASAAMNHYQEKYTDSLMHRTMKRPLPSGLMSPPVVLAMVLALATVGSVTIYLTGNVTALVLSLLAFFSYNVVYTPLKRSTPFAVIPGSFVGAFPVMAGWAAAGGYILDPRLIAVAVFFFIWQIPHFWILMELYSVDYERAGFPTLRMYFNEKTISIWIYAWTAALAVSSFLFVTARVMNNLLPETAVVLLGIWLVLSTFSIVRRAVDSHTLRSAFMKINIYVLAITAVIMVDKII